MNKHAITHLHKATVKCSNCRQSCDQHLVAPVALDPHSLPPWHKQQQSCVS